jgi:hypothetical protein
MAAHSLLRTFPRQSPAVSDVFRTFRTFFGRFGRFSDV